MTLAPEPYPPPLPAKPEEYICWSCGGAVEFSPPYSYVWTCTRCDVSGARNDAAQSGFSTRTWKFVGFGAVRTETYVDHTSVHEPCP